MTLKVAPIQEKIFFSRELGEEMTVLIYLPTAFSPFHHHQLLIAQDGNDYFKFGRIARFIEELAAEQAIENLIVVGIPYKDVNDRRQKYHPDGKQFLSYIRFLAHELVPFIEERYPVLSVGRSRALIGDSLAATVSLMAALHYPHTFGKVIMQSPYVDGKVLEAIDAFSQPSLLSIYHQIGKQETAVKTTDGKIKDFYTINQKLHEQMVHKGFECIYEEFDGDHRWTYWQPLLKDILKKMFAIS
ncbi:esterase family protein [Aeribacillus composti]|uniref:alpha/beta hydrolase n=1 Tax=Aeribacillus composti TaxID=1868734 RepID=UPI002E24BA6F|nr:esterase family protein [Aeribacillus composti]